MVERISASESNSNKCCIQREHEGSDILLSKQNLNDSILNISRNSSTKDESTHEESSSVDLSSWPQKDMSVDNINSSHFCCEKAYNVTNVDDCNDTNDKDINDSDSDVSDVSGLSSFNILSSSIQSYDFLYYYGQQDWSSTDLCELADRSGPMQEEVTTRINPRTATKNESMKKSNVQISTKNIEGRPKGNNHNIGCKRPLKSAFSRKYLDTKNIGINEKTNNSDSKKLQRTASNDNVSINEEKKIFEFDFRVSFKHVYIRKYERILGDHPACSHGPSLSIGWRYDQKEEVYTVEEYECNYKDDFDAYYKDLLDLIISPKERVRIAQSLGYTDDEIKQSIRGINLIKVNRAKTANRLKNSIAHKTEEVFETVLFKLNKMLRNNNKKRNNNDDRTPNVNVNTANNNRPNNYYANYKTVIYQNISNNNSKQRDDGAARSSSSAHAA